MGRHVRDAIVLTTVLDRVFKDCSSCPSLSWLTPSSLMSVKSVLQWFLWLLQTRWNCQTNHTEVEESKRCAIANKKWRLSTAALNEMKQMKKISSIRSIQPAFYRYRSPWNPGEGFTWYQQANPGTVKQRAWEYLRLFFLKRMCD